MVINTKTTKLFEKKKAIEWKIEVSEVRNFHHRVFSDPFWLEKFRFKIKRDRNSNSKSGKIINF